MSSSVVVSQSTINLGFTQTFNYSNGQIAQLQIPMTLLSVFKTSGDALDQCDLIYAPPSLVFVTSTPQVLDLKSLLDVAGAAVVFARLKLFAGRVNSIVDGQVLLMGANGANDFLGFTSSAATATVPIYPGTSNNNGFTIFQAPNTTGMVVGASTHLLKLDPGAHAYTVDLLIAGNVA